MLNIICMSMAFNISLNAALPTIIFDILNIPSPPMEGQKSAEVMVKVVLQG